MAFLTLFATIGRFGVDNYALKFIGGASQRPEKDILRTSRLTVAVSVGITLTICLAVLATGLTYGGASSVSLAIASTAILPLAVSVVAGTTLRGTGNLATGVVAETGSVPLLSIVGIGVGTLVYPQVSMELALTVYAGSSWATAGWAVPLAWTELKRAGDARPYSPSDPWVPFSRWRELVPMMGSSLLAFTMVWAPVFALTLAASPTQVSYYTVGMRLANFIQLVPVIQVSYLAPRFAKYYQSGQIEHLNRLARSSTRRGAAIIAVPATVLALAPAWVLSLLYGDSFTDAAPVVSVLALAFLIQVLSGQVAQLMLLCDLAYVALTISSVGIGAWATIGILVVASFGAIGAACVSLGVTALSSMGGAVWLRRKAGIKSHV